MSPPQTRGRGSTFGRGRKAAIFLNVLVMVLLALTAAGIGTYLTGFTDLRRRIDLTAAETYSLNPETIDLLESLDQDVEIITIFDMLTWHWDRDQVRPQAMDYVVDLLQEYRVRSRGRLSVENLDPRRDSERVRDLFSELDLTQYNRVIVRSGKNRRVLSLDADLAEFDVGSPQPVFRPTRLISYRTEEAISSALFEVTQAEKSKIYVLTGHGELPLSVAGPMGGSYIGTTLAQDNFDLEPLSLVASREVPQDADVLLLLGPQKPFLETELAALDAWLDAGGRMLVSLDPLGDRSLDGLLGELGIELERNIVCFEQTGALKEAQVTEQWIGPASTRSPGTFGTHEITRPLNRSDEPMVMIRSGGIRVRDEALPTFTSLLLSNPQSFGDLPVDETTSGDYRFDARVESRGQRVLGAVIEPAPGEQTGPKVVLMHSVAWITNRALSQVPANDRFLRRSVAWLVGKKKRIFVPPRTPRVSIAELRPGEETDVYLYTAVYLPLAALLAGLLVFLARRS